MIFARQLFVLMNLMVSGLVISSCALKDLKDDLVTAEQEYGFFKGHVVGSDDDSNLLIGLFKRDETGMLNPPVIHFALETHWGEG